MDALVPHAAKDALQSHWLSTILKEEKNALYLFNYYFFFVTYLFKLIFCLPFLFLVILSPSSERYATLRLEGVVVGHP